MSSAKMFEGHIQEVDGAVGLRGTIWGRGTLGKNIYLGRPI